MSRRAESLSAAVGADTFKKVSAGTLEVQAVLPTYPAILRAGTLDWGDNPPPLPRGAVPVHVTILAPLDPAAGGPAMAAALEALAAAGGPADFDDPVEWQREARTERTMPGRDG